MRNFNDIISNGKLHIQTQLQQGDDVQIRANYIDPLTQKRYWCKFTRAMGWEHVTVSGRNKVPDWDVMCKVKEIFWEDEECCVEYHPRKSEYVNNNEYCLHIWKPIDLEFPEPDTILLGFKDIDSEQTGRAIHAMISGMTKEQQFEMAKNLGMKLGNRKMKRRGL